MALRTETETLPFRDAEGNPTSAFYTIRKRLPHDGYVAWMAAIARVPRDAKGNPDLEELQRARHLLLKHGLLGITGVEDENGQPYTAERAFEMDLELTRQIVNELYERNKGEPDPNSAAPSGESGERAPHSPNKISKLRAS